MSSGSSLRLLPAHRKSGAFPPSFFSESPTDVRFDSSSQMVDLRTRAEGSFELLYLREVGGTKGSFKALTEGGGQFRSSLSPNPSRWCG
jgi:hypothetical protein